MIEDGELGSLTLVDLVMPIVEQWALVKLKREQIDAKNLPYSDTAEVVMELNKIQWELESNIIGMLKPKILKFVK